jgi:hypothetical protein
VGELGNHGGFGVVVGGFGVVVGGFGVVVGGFVVGGFVVVVGGFVVVIGGFVVVIVGGFVVGGFVVVIGGFVVGGFVVVVGGFVVVVGGFVVVVGAVDDPTTQRFKFASHTSFDPQHTPTLLPAQHVLPAGQHVAPCVSDAAWQHVEPESQQKAELLAPGPNSPQHI